MNMLNGSDTRKLVNEAEFLVTNCNDTVDKLLNIIKDFEKEYDQLYENYLALSEQHNSLLYSIQGE